MKIISAIIIAAGLFLFIVGNIYSQDVNNKSVDSSNDTQILEQKSKYSIVFSKKSKPTENSFFNNLSNDGNNFFGISISNEIILSKKFSLQPEASIAYGNINGINALNIILMPQISIDLSLIKFSFCSGPSFLTTNTNEANYGGIGISSSFTIEMPIYNNFGIEMNFGFETYGIAKYNTMSLAATYAVE